MRLRPGKTVSFVVICLYYQVSGLLRCLARRDCSSLRPLPGLQERHTALGPSGPSLDSLNGIILYLEYGFQSICPIVRIDFFRPLSRKRVCLPPWNLKGGGNHLRVRGAGEPIRMTGKKKASHCLLCGLSPF
jgi:hypothetical protein